MGKITGSAAKGGWQDRSLRSPQDEKENDICVMITKIVQETVELWGLGQRGLRPTAHRKRARARFLIRYSRKID